MYINPLLNDDVNKLSIDGIRVGEHNICVRLQKRDSVIALEFSHSGDSPITLITSAGKVEVRNETIQQEITNFMAPHWLEL